MEKEEKETKFLRGKINNLEIKLSELAELVKALIFNLSLYLQTPVLLNEMLRIMI